MQGDVFGVVVPRNTPIPTNKSRTFTTVEDNQTTVTFPVYEGERVTCKENRLLGEFEVRSLLVLPSRPPLTKLASPAFRHHPSTPWPGRARLHVRG